MDIGEWLRSLDLERYEGAFREGEIDFQDVLEVTDADLKDLGIPVGPRRRLLKAIRELGAAGPTAEVKPTSPHPAPKPRDTAERRQLTVMFCDLVGSTALSAKMDPEDLREVISAYQAACTNLIETHDGLLAKFMGDGILAYYGYPRAHEDDAERAVRAGLDIVRGVSSLKTRVPEPLQVRIGIATGLVVVGDLIGSGEAQERGVVGETPNLAARLQSLATPNSIVIGPSTRRILGDLFEYEDLGRIEVKGFDAPVRAYQVLGPSLVESRFEALRTTTTPLVGRDEELDLLMRRWERAKEGDGQVVLICGEPGIGKSRITQAIQDRLGVESNTRLRYFCSPHHQDSALYPIITQLERAAGLRRDDTNEQRLGKLEITLARAANDLSEAVPLLAELLSISTGERYAPLELTPQKRKEKTLKTLLAQVEGLAARDPVLMMFEDVHWVDPTTREFLDLLVDRASVLRALVIVTFRPEFTPPWIGRPQVTLLALSRLPPRQRADMIAKVVKGKALPKEIADQIIERTDGIPLFIEELTKAVIESGVVAEAGDHYEFTGSLTPLAIPTSLHSTYLFKYALVQDVAYGTLLREPRRALHARIADTLESQFAEIAERQPELLAHHCTEAGLIEKAAVLWGKAGQRSLAHSAMLEATAQLSRSLAQIATLPGTSALRREQIKLQVALANGLMHAKGYASPETRASFDQARLYTERAEALGEPPEDPLLQFSVLYGLWVANFVAFNGEMVRLATEDDVMVSDRRLRDRVEWARATAQALNPFGETIAKVKQWS